MAVMKAEEIIELLDMQPLDVEGGMWKAMYRSDEPFYEETQGDRRGPHVLYGSILYLLRGDSVSRMHRLATDEIWHFYMGAACELTVLCPDGTGYTERLGHDLAAGEQVTACVRRGYWQGARIIGDGDWALLGTTMAPGYEDSDYEDGTDDLMDEYPQFRENISKLLKRPEDTADAGNGAGSPEGSSELKGSGEVGEEFKVRKIYFDLDGVMADFDRGVHELCGMDAFSHDDDLPFSDDLMWERIKEVDHFYDKLELMPGALELFNDLYAKYGDKCEILSGIPKPKRGILTAGDDKINWVHRMLSEDIKVNIVYKEEKPKYCYGEDCILIDDLPANILAWEKIGGTGVMNSGAEDTREILEEMGVL